MTSPDCWEALIATAAQAARTVPSLSRRTMEDLIASIGKHDGLMVIPHLSVGILGGVQPDKLTLIINGKDDGFAARMLWCWPEAVPGFTVCRDALDDGEAEEAFRRLAALPVGSVGGRPYPLKVPLEDDAADAIERFGREMNSRGFGASGVFASALGKARGHALRLSACLEYAWWCMETGPEPQSISIKAVEAAAGLMKGYFLRMAEIVFGTSAVGPDERAAETLAKHLRKDGMTRFNARTLRLTVGGDLRPPARMNSACQYLCEAGLIRPSARVSSGQIGRPAKDYEVNPLLLRGRAP